MKATALKQHSSPVAAATTTAGKPAANSLQLKAVMPLQRMQKSQEKESGTLQAKAVPGKPFQLQNGIGQETMQQGRPLVDNPFRFKPVQKKENNTGLPDHLKSGVENLSGFSMDDVQVHYNSDKPAQLQAHAYAQGTDIHVAPGQERHLPHEAWHIVQQKQGRVQPTLQMKQGIAVNDDEGLEEEADNMGKQAIQTKQDTLENSNTAPSPGKTMPAYSYRGVAQLGRKTKKKYFLTRILRQDQLRRRNIGTNSVRSSSRSINRNMNSLVANGKGKSIGTRIYTYMRKYGGAGIQGFHREADDISRARVVRPILEKMNGDTNRTTKSGRGKKFVMIVTHRDLIGRGRVHDLKRSRVRREVVSGNRSNYGNMYNKHAVEGVVAVDGDVTPDQVLAMRAFRGVPGEEALEEILNELLAVAQEKLEGILEEEEEPVEEDDDDGGLDEPKRKDEEEDEDGDNGGWGGMGLGQPTNDIMVS